jgi:hypothetical protein
MPLPNLLRVNPYKLMVYMELVGARLRLRFRREVKGDLQNRGEYHENCNDHPGGPRVHGRIRRE